jgi:hypothetical protein
MEQQNLSDDGTGSLQVRFDAAGISASNPSSFSR